MYRETTIVDQKLEDFSEKWIEATENKQGRIIRVHAKRNEDIEFVDTFFKYLLSPESLPDDIAFCFETEFSSKDTFSKALLEELEEILNEWNTAEKAEGIDFEPIDWKPDYTLESKDNSANLFIANINNFAESLNLEKGTVLTPVLMFYSNKTKAINNWLNDALDAGISPLVRIAICDTEENPVFGKLALNHSNQLITVKPEVDMDNIMAQLAASGDPKDPATPYRYSFVCLIQAIGKKDKKLVKKHGDECLKIATDNVAKNPYWISQLIGLYMMLSNAYLAFKDKKQMYYYADSAVAVSQMGEEFLDSEIYYRQQGQAFLYRAGIYSMEKQWEKALADSQAAGAAYEACNDYVLQVEAFRMEGYIAKKIWGGDPVTPLVKGAKLGTLIAPDVIEASSYTMLISQLLKTDYQKQISDEELDSILIPIWGQEWRDELKKISEKYLFEEG
ncbi:hypothetical protein [Dysgonomonas sp. 511]|uniref:hypothetical protein n=1 Tax=Dysgonomonas sp. 511 TaxID=2302930 RepID=UPI0013D4A940|nr:hypothetical protein [Dysgonomonas sp. 511]NDV78471.1 hypothetical protein [Dysgonomonas sp. 511]